MLSTSNSDNLKSEPKRITATSVYTNYKLRALMAHRPKSATHISYDTLLDILEAFLFHPGDMARDDRYCVCCNAAMWKKNWTNHSKSRNHIKALELWERKIQKIIEILQAQT